jgi:hypothetical protein
LQDLGVQRAGAVERALEIAIRVSVVLAGNDLEVPRRCTT